MQTEEAVTKVLVADDEPAVRTLIGSLIDERGDCDYQLAEDGAEALAMLASWPADVLVTDLKMPKLGGEKLAARALELYPDLTILVETGFPSIDGAVRLMRHGVYDFIQKPFSIDAIEARLDSAVQNSRRCRARRRVDATIDSLMEALGRKDEYLREHGKRVASFCTLLAQDLGLSHDDVRAVAWMGLVHDVGKIGIPESVLCKPSGLTKEEFDLIREHPIHSAEIIRPLLDITGWPRAYEAVLHHHERIDGLGYPDGLQGDYIPLESRIIAVCDTYDAMASQRPYQEALPENLVRENIEQARGTQLDAEIATVFLENLDRYKKHAVISR